MRKIGDSRYIYPNALDKNYFQHHMVYGDLEDLPRRTASDKILCDKAFSIANNPKCDGYKRGPASMAYKCFDKKASRSGIKNENILSKKLAEELQKQIIRKFKKRKVHSSLIDSIGDADLADMQLTSKFNRGIHVLLCAIDVFSKYAWVILLKDKKCITMDNIFQKIVD